MLIGLFEAVRRAGVPATIRELLDLVALLERGAVFADIEGFYFVARAALVKDERWFDRFDRAFGDYLRGVANTTPDLSRVIPEEWLRKTLARELTDEEKAAIRSLGSFEKLIKTLQQRLREQQERHAGGNRWIGTGGTSPFGHGGFHPEGIRIGGSGGGRRAVKVWEQRAYRNLDGDAELGTRNIKLALRRLRRFAREGAAEELDINATIGATAREAGLLDVRMRPERRNAVKVLLLLDIGGSMDDHVLLCEQLFAAARSEFKRLEHFYFHNCVYDHVWKDNRRRSHERTPTFELLRRYPRDYRVVFVGDAAMSPYEITEPGGSVEYWNEEAGAVWLRRFADRFRHLVWLNPSSREHWRYTASTQLIRELLDDRMYPATPAGIEQAMRRLTH